jgi:hypothetical protein
LKLQKLVNITKINLINKTTILDLHTYIRIYLYTYVTNKIIAMKKYTMNMEEDYLINLKTFAAINGTTVKAYIISLINKDMEKRNICMYNYSHQPNKNTILALNDKNTEKLNKVEDIWK